MKKLLTIILITFSLQAMAYDYICFSRQNGFPYRMTNSGYMDADLYTLDFDSVKEKTIKFAEEKLDNEFWETIEKGMQYTDPVSGDTVTMPMTAKYRMIYKELISNADNLIYPYGCYGIEFETPTDIEEFYQAIFLYVQSLEQACYTQKKALKTASEEEVINIIFNQ